MLQRHHSVMVKQRRALGPKYGCLKISMPQQQASVTLLIFAYAHLQKGRGGSDAALERCNGLYLHFSTQRQGLHRKTGPRRWV